MPEAASAQSSNPSRPEDAKLQQGQLAAGRGHNTRPGRGRLTKITKARCSYAFLVTGSMKGTGSSLGASGIVMRLASIDLNVAFITFSPRSWPQVVP